MLAQFFQALQPRGFVARQVRIFRQQFVRAGEVGRCVAGAGEGEEAFGQFLANEAVGIAGAFAFAEEGALFG